MAEVASTTMTSVLNEIFTATRTGLKTPIASFKAGTASQKSTGGFGVVGSGFDLFSSFSQGNVFTAGNAVSTLEGAASLAVIFSTNPYLLFGVAAWFCAKGLFNAVTKGLPALAKGNVTEAAMVFGKSALDIAFNCSALKVFKQFGISKILSTGLAPRAEASLGKLLVSSADDAASATAKLAQTTATVGAEVKTAQGMVANSIKGIQATEAEVLKIAEKQAAAKLVTEAAEKVAKEAAENLAKNAADKALQTVAKEAAEKAVQAKTIETALITEKEIAEAFLKKSNEAYANASILLKNRRLALKDAKKAEELFKTSGLTDEVIALQKTALQEELTLKASDFAYDLTRVGFGDKEAEAAASMVRGTRNAFRKENIDATVATVKGTVSNAASRVIPKGPPVMPPPPGYVAGKHGLVVPDSAFSKVA